MEIIPDLAPVAVLAFCLAMRRRMSLVLTDSASGFIAAMAAYLLEPSEIVSDGKVHRFATAEDKGRSKLDGMFFMMTETLLLALMATGVQAYQKNGVASAKSR
jgi:hypothetical protein